VAACLADVVILGGSLTGNRATAALGTMGGGALLATGTSSTLSVSANCAMSGNTSGANGGAVSLLGVRPVSMATVQISGNTAGASGGGISCLESSPTLTNCTLTSNSAVASGGAINCYTRSSVTVLNCTLSGNRLSGIPATGGGLYCGNASFPSIVNTIFEGHNGYAVYADTGTNPSRLVACLFFNDTNGGALRVPGNTYQDNQVAAINALAYARDNVTGDPAFVNKAAGNCDIRFVSAAIDRATSRVTTGGPILLAPTTDIRGFPRPKDYPAVGRNGTGEGYDIGAYEGYFPSIVASPLSATYTFPEGTAAPITFPLNVSNGTTYSTILQYTITTSSVWLHCAPTAGTSTSNEVAHTVTIVRAGLNAGDYAGTITISSFNADNSPVLIPVTLHVTNVPPTVSIDSIAPNPAQPPSDLIQFRGSAGDAAGAITARQWRSSLDGVLSAQEDFSKSSYDMTVGSHLIAFEARDDEGTTSVATASLTVLNALPTASIVSLNPNPAAAGAVVNVSLAGQDNDEQGLSIADGELVWTDGLHSGVLPGVRQFAAPALAGSYTIQYRTQDDEGTWSAPSTATLFVVRPTIAARPTSISLTVVEGRTASRTLTVWNSGSSILRYIADTTPTQWLEIDPQASSSTGVSDPTTHTVTWDADTLLPGDCDATITLTDPAATNSPLRIPVHATVTTGPIIGWTPGRLDLVALAQTDAATQTLEIWNAGRETLAYIVDTTPTWLVAQPRVGFSNGPTSRTVQQIGFRTSSLAAGDYDATITIVDPGARNNPAIVPVHLKIVFLRVILPAGGEVFSAGMSREIVWESHGACGQVAITLIRPGLTRQLILAPNQDGINRVLVRLPLDLQFGNDYRIRVSCTACSGTAQADSAPFTIYPRPGFAITFPTSGTIWQAGTSRNFLFTCTNLPTPGQAYLHLWRSGAYVRYLGRVPCAQGANTVPLRLPINLAAGSGYQLHMFWTENTDVRAFSQSFVVTPPPTLLLAVEGSDPQADNETSTSGSFSQDP